MPSRLLPNDHVPSHTPLPPPAPLVRQKSSFAEPYRIKRASSHVWVVVMACHTGPNDTVLRNGFLRKVFGILVAQIALAAVVSIQMLNAGQARVDEARAAPELLSIDLCEDKISSISTHRSISCGKKKWGKMGEYATNGECNDGGYGSVNSVCAFGTDCSDCGMRPKGTPIPVIPADVAVAPYMGYFWPVFAASFLLIIAISFCGFKDSYPVNYFLLLAFTGVMSYFLGISCTAYGVDQHGVVYEAFTITAALFVSMTAFTIQTRIKLVFNCGFVLCCSLWALLLMGCLHIFVFPESSLLHTACLYFGVMLFSLYIVFDASMICNKLGYDDYVVAVFELYLDIIYYFLVPCQYLANV